MTNTIQIANQKLLSVRESLLKVHIHKNSKIKNFIYITICKNILINLYIELQ